MDPTGHDDVDWDEEYGPGGPVELEFYEDGREKSVTNITPGSEYWEEREYEYYSDGKNIHVNVSKTTYRSNLTVSWWETYDDLASDMEGYVQELKKRVTGPPVDSDDNSKTWISPSLQIIHFNAYKQELTDAYEKKIYDAVDLAKRLFNPNKNLMCDYFVIFVLDLAKAVPKGWLHPSNYIRDHIKHWKNSLLDEPALGVS